MLDSKSESSQEVQSLREEIQRLERQLQESEYLASKWREIAEYAPGYIYKIDRDYRLIYVNRAGDDYTLEEVIGLSLEHMTAPDDWPRVKSLLESVFNQGETIRYEAKEIISGEWYGNTIAPQRVGGEIKYAIGVTQNIDERKQKEEALVLSEAQLELSVTQIPAILWTADLDLIIQSSEGTGLHKLGLKPKQLIGVRLTDVLQTEDKNHPALKAVYGALEGKSSAYELDFSGIPYETRVDPLRNQNDEIIGCIAFSLDISERVEKNQALLKAQEELRDERDNLERNVEDRTNELAKTNLQLTTDIQRREAAEKKLRESEERFRVITESSPVPILISQAGSGKFLYANQTFTETFLIDPEQLESFLSPDFYCDLSIRAGLIDSLQQSGSIHGEEVQFYRGDGSTLWSCIYVRPIKYQGNDAVLTCFLDISDRKASEEELEKERRLLRRLLDLHDRDRQLIAYEIHDGVVQDMSAALMFIESAGRQLSEGDEEGLEDLDKGSRLLRSCVSEARLIIDGLRPPVLEEAGIIAAVENLVEEIQYASGIKIELSQQVQFDRIAPALEMAIYRIVQESLHNVSQHSKTSTAQVRLSQDKANVLIEVIDYGEGFDDKVVKKRRYGIEGIHERARLLEGTSSISSSPGKGTHVSVRLPLTDSLLPSEES